MTPTPKEAEIHTRLLSYGFRRNEIADEDRMPEQLILSHLSDSPSTAPELEALAWWKHRARRMDLAFHRLRATGQIEFGPGARWRARQTVERVEAADHQPKQRSLF